MAIQDLTRKKTQHILQQIRGQPVSIKLGYARVLLLEIGQIVRQSQTTPSRKVYVSERGDFSFFTQSRWQFFKGVQCILDKASSSTSVIESVSFCEEPMIVVDVRLQDTTGITFLFNNNLVLRVTFQPDEPECWFLIFRQERKVLTATHQNTFVLEPIQ